MTGSTESGWPMGRPEMTDDQREMLIELFANALRKDAHLRARLSESPGDPLQAGMARRRLEASRRYIDGMRDIVRVLFLDGYPAAEACLEAAYARAMGVERNGPSGDDVPYQ